MPNTTSAKKALRQSEKRRTKNLSAKRNVKQVVKRFNSLVAGGKIEEANNELPGVFKTLDKAAKNGIIKKNKSSRLKSRLSSKLNSNKPSSSETEG